MKHAKTLKSVLILVAIQVTLVTAFVLPSHKPEPHHVPVGYVGSARLAAEIDGASPGAYSATRYASSRNARRAIAHRKIYGALVGDRRLLVASAASAPVAGLLAETFGGRNVEDLKPLAAEDPHGATLNLVFLPLIMIGLTGAFLLSRLGLSGRGLLVTELLFAALGGLAVVAVVGEGIGALPGSYLTLSAVAALTMLAVSLSTAGFVRLLGPGGMAVGALLFFLIGNPASGNGSAPQLLPGFWRVVSQWLPPGAGGSALRNVAYFDGDATLRPLLVLAAYALVGATLVLAADAIRRVSIVPGKRPATPPIRPAKPGRSFGA